jgi:PEP-CTERM motif.
MRTHHVFPQVCAILMTLLVPSIAFSDTTATTIYNTFNAMNSGQGYLFNSNTDSSYTYNTTGTGEARLFNRGSDMADTSAYAATTSGANYFQTFCVEPTRILDPNDVNAGKLNYANNRTSTVRNGLTNESTVLTLGAAYLYKEFAAGTLTGYNYTGANHARDAALLQDAIWYLTGHTSYLAVTTNVSTIWTENKFLATLNTIGGYNWSEIYDPGQSYTGLMNDYRVFIMQNTTEVANSGGMGILSTTIYRQDVLYVAKGGGGSDVPEPASILLWTLGSLGAAGVAYRKRRAAK